MRREVIIKIAKILKALGNDKRLCIVMHLAQRELKVNELEQLIGLSQSALSQHLAILRAEKIVKTRREAQSIFYSLADKDVLELLNILRRIYAAD